MLSLLKLTNDLCLQYGNELISNLQGEGIQSWKTVLYCVALVRRLRALASAALPWRGGNLWDVLHLFPF